MRWFNLEWWKYLLAKPASGTNRWIAFWCRRKGHENVVWYDVSALEPDMHCRNCYDDLG